MKPDQQRVKNLLADTVTLLCKNGLTYKEELRIEGLVGITIDNNEVFLVHINESFSGASTNVKSATPTVTPALDLPGYLKSAENHTESTNNAHSVQHKPNRIACPRQTVPTSTNSPLQLSKAQGRKSPKLSHNSNVQSPSSVTATTENYDTGQAVKLEDDDDDDVVIVSEVSNKRKHNNKTEEQEMDSSQNAIAQQAFPNVDFSALQDDQGFTDSLVDAGQSLSSKEPPMKRNRSQDDSQYMASIKHEQDTMTLDDSTSNQWENLTSMPGCSDWPGDDDSGLNQTQLGQTDAGCGSQSSSYLDIHRSCSISDLRDENSTLVVLPLSHETEVLSMSLGESSTNTSRGQSCANSHRNRKFDSSRYIDPIRQRKIDEATAVLLQEEAQRVNVYKSKNYAREKRNLINKLCRSCEFCGPLVENLLVKSRPSSDDMAHYEREMYRRKRAVVQAAEQCLHCSRIVQLVNSWKPSVSLQPLRTYVKEGLHNAL